MIRSHGKVLIVDDESAIRRALHNTLHGMGFDVDDASCGEAALDLARDAAYDVVLMDINMPGIGGIRACRELRKKLPRLGILMLTVRDCEEDKVTALDAGADDYITPAYTVVSARHHMLWPATVRRIDVPACVWVCCASLGGSARPEPNCGDWRAAPPRNMASVAAQLCFLVREFLVKYHLLGSAETTV
jgi:two-component system KDP operon response regulator KdpE